MGIQVIERGLAWQKCINMALTQILELDFVRFIENSYVLRAIQLQMGMFIFRTLPRLPGISL